MTDKVKQMLEVYFIAGSQNVFERSLLEVLKEALQAGITCFQFREKGKGSLVNDPEAVKELAKECQELCHKYDVPFIINDSLDLAKELKADGVHVGQNDKPIEEIIQEVGDQMIIGYSTNNLEQFLEAEGIEGIDYVGIGPAYTPASKDDHEPVIGVNGIKEAMKRRTHLPAVAIGGITTTNVKEVLETGVEGVAVVSEIAQSSSIKETVSQLKQKK
jgi:thiamine-phosphate pyrophosphorylase